MFFLFNSSKCLIFILFIIYFNLAILSSFQAFNLFKYNLDLNSVNSFKPVWILAIILMFLNSLFGFYALIKESVLKIKIFSFFVFAILIIQIPVNWILFKSTSGVSHKLIEFKVKDSFKNYNESHFYEKFSNYIIKSDVFKVQHDIQMIQQDYDCCGVHNFAEFGPAPNSTPNSCCSRYIKEKYSDLLILSWHADNVQYGKCKLEELLSKKGCKELFWNEFENYFFNFNIFHVNALISYIFQILTAITSFNFNK